MDAKLAQDKIKTALKQLLKKQNHTYADVAKVWGCSIPTVKRQLGAEELPVSRLLTLLEWLGLSLSDLQKLAESESLEYPKWTAKQSEFLAKNPRMYAFVVKLYEDMTPEQIAKKYRISAAELDKILVQLEKYDIIKVGAGGKVRPTYDRSPSLDGSLAIAHIGRTIDNLAKYHKVQIVETIAERARGLPVRKGQLSWSVAEVTEKTYLETKEKVRQIIDDFAQTAKLESKTQKKSELKVAVVNYGFFLNEMDDKRLAPVRDIFDHALQPSTE